VLSSLLDGVSRHDPLVLLGAVLIPIVVAAASHLSSRRAARPDLAVVLRTE
jgi:hypothetical protein